MSHPHRQTWILVCSIELSVGRGSRCKNQLTKSRLKSAGQISTCNTCLTYQSESSEYSQTGHEKTAQFATMGMEMHAVPVSLKGSCGLLNDTWVNTLI